MGSPALAVLLDRAARNALGGDRSGEQRGHGDGGEGDGDVTHGVFSLALCRWHSLLDIPHNLFMQNLYSRQRYLRVSAQKEINYC
jgi:hypothetical protein